MRASVWFPERTQQMQEKPHLFQMHGPSCKGCGSRRTKRVGETAARQCMVCGRSSLYGALIPEGK